MAKASNEPSHRTEQVSYRLAPTLVKKIRYIVYKDDVKHNDIAEKALEEYIERWEKKNGKIKID